MGDGEDTEQQDEQQSDDNEWSDDVIQAIITLEDTPFWTDECQTPVGSWYWLIIHKTRLSIKPDRHTALFACCHLMAQCKDIGVLLWISIAVDGLAEELCRIRMQ